ncbi:12519_t:CDS:1, partial [Funneliformis mosseae]
MALISLALRSNLWFLILTDASILVVVSFTLVYNWAYFMVEPSYGGSNGCSP